MHRPGQPRGTANAHGRDTSLPYEPRQEKGAADSGQAPFSTAKKRPGQGMAGAFLWEGKPYKREKRKKGRDQRWMRPEPSPPASFSTSETVTML